MKDLQIMIEKDVLFIGSFLGGLDTFQAEAKCYTSKTFGMELMVCLMQFKINKHILFATNCEVESFISYISPFTDCEYSVDSDSEWINVDVEFPYISEIEAVGRTRYMMYHLVHFCKDRLLK